MKEINHRRRKRNGKHKIKKKRNNYLTIAVVYIITSILLNNKIGLFNTLTLGYIAISSLFRIFAKREKYIAEYGFYGIYDLLGFLVSTKLLHNLMSQFAFFTKYRLNLFIPSVLFFYLIFRFKIGRNVKWL